MTRAPSRSVHVAAAASILFAVAFAAVGCALLVPATLDDMHCTEEGAVGPPVCPLGSICFEGTCRDGPPPPGEPCGAEGMCAPGDECVEPSAWGLSGEAICTRSCCSSADCGVGTNLVCHFVGPGKLCVPADAVGRGELGERFAGQECESDAQCRSGECSAPHNLCADTCCSDVECAPFGGECVATKNGWACAPKAPPKIEYPTECKQNVDCASGVCADWPDGARRCAMPCCSTTECGFAKTASGLRRIRCVPVRAEAVVLLACAGAAPESAVLENGEPCTDSAECIGGRCIDVSPAIADGTTHVCSDSCCTDASCGAPHLFACVPAVGWDPPQDEQPPGRIAQLFDLQCVLR